HRVKTKDIMYIEADQVYLHVVLIHKKTIIIRQSLKTMLSELTDDNLIQCHRSYIVNKNHIKSWNTSQITLTDNTEIPVSRNYNLIINK
ncbi:MAG TPA: LytTR family DNA-binding domain-containing protein, partial [Saprospiraceae bacterium]|nr:LytTR family DNA-binding domain-containing protein [Saprospiraceae bacterium]